MENLYIDSGYKLSSDKCLEFSKKIAVLQKIYRNKMVTEAEYILIKNRILDEYHIDESYFPSDRKVA